MDFSWAGFLRVRSTRHTSYFLQGKTVIRERIFSYSEKWDILSFARHLEHRQNLEEHANTFEHFNLM